MSDVSHGVNAGKTDSGAITPVSVETGVPFCSRYSTRAGDQRKSK